MYSIISLISDYSIEGQVNQISNTCTHTCTTHHYICAQENLPSCSCPGGQVIYDGRGCCVYLQNSPSKKCL